MKLRITIEADFNEEVMLGHRTYRESGPRGAAAVEKWLLHNDAGAGVFCNSDIRTDVLAPTKIVVEEVYEPF